MNRVLIVEDDRSLASMLSEVLVQSGYEVECARDAATGEAVLAAKAVDAAILDVRLEGGMVFPLARALAARGIPYLLASSTRRLDMPPDLRWQPLIAKPYRPEQLVTALRALCGDLAARNRPAPARTTRRHPAV